MSLPITAGPIAYRPACRSDEEEEEIVRGNNSIKRVSGQFARGYRSPAWDLSPHSIDLLLKHRIKYDSSLMGHDYDCYYARHREIWRRSIQISGVFLWRERCSYVSRYLKCLPGEALRTSTPS